MKRGSNSFESPFSTTCRICNGEGKVPNHHGLDKITCSNCGGTGKIKNRQINQDDTLENPDR